MVEQKKDPQAEATRELLKLLKSKDLDPEECKKILTIATSMGHSSAGKETPGGEPSNFWKATLIGLAVLGLMLMGLAYFMLQQIQKSVQKTGPPASRPTVVAPARPGRTGGGPGRSSRGPAGKPSSAPARVRATPTPMPTGESASGDVPAEEEPELRRSTGAGD